MCLLYIEKMRERKSSAIDPLLCAVVCWAGPFNGRYWHFPLGNIKGLKADFSSDDVFGDTCTQALRDEFCALVG